MSTNRTKGRVVIPSNSKEALDTAAKIYAKHLADGAASPLNALADFNWVVVGPTVATALADHEGAVDFSAKAEKLYRQRDTALVDINGIVRSSAAVLKGIYAKNPKKLGDWGLQIDDTPKEKKVPKPTA